MDTIKKFHQFGGPKEEIKYMYAEVLAKAWKEINERKEELEHSVEGTSMRHSMSGKCARQIYYYLSKEPISNPFDLPAIWVMGLGTRIHEWWQEALRAAYPTAQVEVTVHIPDADSSGHVDATIVEDEEGEPFVTCLELKSINGFGFKKMAENGDPPRHSDMVQCCVNAYGIQADKAVLIYLAAECVSRGRAKQKGLSEHERFMKEYIFDKETIEKVAIKEIMRWDAIRKMGDNTPRKIPDPEYPAGAAVADPSTGKLSLNGSISGYAWQCGYCAYQDKCCEDMRQEKISVN
jgi:hypothetical protein